MLERGGVEACKMGKGKQDADPANCFLTVIQLVESICHFHLISHTHIL